MQTRIEAMIAAVGTVQPPLDHFYGLLNDEQKARLTALGQDQRNQQPQENRRFARAKLRHRRSPVRRIGRQPKSTSLHPTDAQRASLTTLQEASAKAADMLKASCQPDATLTPPARLAAVGKRLDVDAAGGRDGGAALDDLYSDLTDEQKAQFEAIGPGRVARRGFASVTRPRRRRDIIAAHHASVGGIRSPAYFDRLVIRLSDVTISGDIGVVEPARGISAAVAPSAARRSATA